MPLGRSARFGEGRFSRSRFSVVGTLYGFNPLNYGKPVLALGLSYYTNNNETRGQLSRYSVAGGFRKDLG